MPQPPWKSWYKIVRWRQLGLRIFLRDLYTCQCGCGQVEASTSLLVCENFQSLSAKWRRFIGRCGKLLACPFEHRKARGNLTNAIVPAGTFAPAVRRDRKPGGQPNNQNAVTHGRYTKAHRLQRLADAAEKQRNDEEWVKKMPRTDYGAIADRLRRLGQSKERGAVQSPMVLH